MQTIQPPETQVRHLPSILPALILAGWLLLAGGLVMYVTRWGIGTSPDSAAYLGTAANLLDGRGLNVPYGDPPGQALVYYPPLYPLFLAAGGLFGSPLTQTTRWLQVILFSCNLLVGWFFLRRLISKPAWLPAVLLFPLAASTALLTLHSMAWSEGLFLLTGFGGLLLTGEGLAKPDRRRMILGSILLGLATLTRYSGLAFIAAAVLAALLSTPGHWLRRIANTLLASLPGLALFAAWAIRNLLVSGNLANRSLEFHPLTRAHLNQALDTAAGWFLIPLNLPGVVKIGLLGLLAAACLVALLRGWSRFQPPAQWMLRLLAAFVVVYPAFLVVSISFVDANTPLDDRILSPLLMAAWLLIAAAIGQSIPAALPQRRTFAVLVSLLAILFTGSTLVANAASLQTSREQGMGFLHAAWRDSPLIAQIQALPDDTIVYTNSAEAVYLLTGRPAVPLPRKTDLTRQKPNPGFSAGMQRLQSNLQQGNTVIVVFKAIRASAFPTIEEMEQLLPGEMVRLETADGALITSGGDS